MQDGQPKPVAMAVVLHTMAHRLNQTWRYFKMKKERSVFLSIVIGLASLALLASATPLVVTGHSTSAQVPAQAQSITGKIASVEKSSFTLTVGSAVTKESAAQQTNERTMKFDVDKNTTIDGKLQVGKTADVTYRENNGSYLAISVRVEP